MGYAIVRRQFRELGFAAAVAAVIVIVARVKRAFGSFIVFKHSDIRACERSSVQGMLPYKYLRDDVGHEGCR